MELWTCESVTGHQRKPCEELRKEREFHFVFLTLAVFTNPNGRSMLQKDFIDVLHSRMKARVQVKFIFIEPDCVQKYLTHMGFRWHPRWALAKILTYDLMPSCIDWFIQLDTDTILRSGTSVRNTFCGRHTLES